MIDKSKLDEAFNAEIVRVSTLEYNAQEICRHFYAKLCERLATTASTEPADQATDARAWMLWMADGSHVEIQTNAPTVEALGNDPGWRCAEIPGKLGADQVAAISSALASVCVASRGAAQGRITSLACYSGGRIAAIPAFEDEEFYLAGDVDAVLATPAADVGGLTRYALIGNLMNPHPHGAYVRFDDLSAPIASQAKEAAEQGANALASLHKELNRITWEGVDEGWNRAITAVQKRIGELLAAQPSPIPPTRGTGGSVDAGCAVPAVHVVVPQTVRDAVNRMCQPLDESRLSGVTAQADAFCMGIIKSFIDSLAAAPVPPAAPAEPTSHRFGKLDVLEAWKCVRKHNHSIPDDALDDMRDTLYAAIAAPAEQQSAQAAPTVKAMVDRFLGWKLPADFAPDCGISFKRESDYDHPQFGRTKFEPIGTNLLSADQAKAMFEYVLAAPTVQEVEQPHNPVPCMGCDGESVDTPEFRIYAQAYALAFKIDSKSKDTAECFDALCSRITVLIDRRVAAARRDALEEAAKTCGRFVGLHDGVRRAAAAIRSLSTAADSQGERQ